VGGDWGRVMLIDGIRKGMIKGRERQIWEDRDYGYSAM
jgi:hypothetical protein